MQGKLAKDLRRPAGRKLSARKTWCLLRHLIDPLSSKTATKLIKVLNTYKGDSRRPLEDLKAKYLNTEKGQYPVPESCEGPDNEELDSSFTITELWTAIDESNKRSAPSRDAITYKLLGNMSGVVARGLREHINEAWESSRLAGPPALPDLLKQIEGVDQAFYADDIALSTARAGSDAWAEEASQRAATTVHEYAKSTAIKPTQHIRILGLLLESDGKAQATITKIKTTTEQIHSMIRRVSNRNRGLKEDDAKRLVRAFIVSWVTYSVPYLQLVDEGE
ncbi:hypothetical protein MTO96_043873 [Rhipicephalus appendiculatus]